MAAVPGHPPRALHDLASARTSGATSSRRSTSVPALCDHVHLPVQSGSTRVLRAMRRTYTREEYLEKIVLIREAGGRSASRRTSSWAFPARPSEDFEQTLSLLDAAQYRRRVLVSNIRRGRIRRRAPMADAVPEEEKARRLASRCRSASAEIQVQRNKSLVGQTFEVLVDGAGAHRESQWSGRTSSNRVLNFTSPRDRPFGTISCKFANNGRGSE